MKKFFAGLVAMFMLAMSSVTFAATEINNSGAIQAEGIAAANQGQAIGYLGAHVAALRNLLGVVKGVQIDADTTMENLYVTNDVIHARVEGIIKNAVTVKQFKDETGSYHEVVELRIFNGKDSVADLVIPQVEKKPLPAPEIFVDKAAAEGEPAASATSGNYTGVIIDCSGLDIQTAMAPGIFTKDNQAVYGLEHFSHDFVISNGYVSYSKGMATVARAGANPLVIKAVSVSKFVNPVISNADAGKILAENKVSHFLDEAKVVFVK